MRQAGWAFWLYQISPSIASTEQIWTSPPSTLAERPSRKRPQSSFWLQLPRDVGKRSMGRPQLPYQSSSIERESAGLSHR